MALGMVLQLSMQYGSLLIIPLPLLLRGRFKAVPHPIYISIQNWALKGDNSFCPEQLKLIFLKDRF